MKKILLVEDDKDVANFIVNFLKRKGFDVDAVYDLDSAFKVFNSDYKVVILDLLLKDQLSFPFLKKIKEENPLVKVIILTGYDNEENIMQAKKLGADAFIGKPLTAEFLENLLLSKLHSFQDK